jgi:signal transduction histidine kinase
VTLTDRPVRTGSLRRRLIVSVLALLLAVLVGLGLIVNLVLSDRLRSDLRQRLADRGALATALASQSLTPQNLTDRLTGQGITATYQASGDQQVIVGRDEQPPGSNGGNPRGQPPSGPRSTPRTAAVAVSRQGQQLQAEVRTAGGTVRLVANLVDIERTMATLTRIELAAGAATLLLSALMLAAVVRFALAPLGRMTRLARRIRDGARGGRLRPTKPNTDLGRTAAAFDEMLDALEQAETDARRAEIRMRTFLADASHDLRTPIAGVITTAEQMLRTDEPLASREARLVILIREAQRAGRLVDDLLLMTRLDADSQATSSARTALIDVRQLAVAAVQRAALSAPGRQVRLVADPAATVLGDPDAVERMLSNLLDNARQATPAGGRIDVTMRVVGGQVWIEVADTGPGVAAQDAERIFNRFVRGDPARSRGSTGSGTGLGLPIARALARGHGGDLSCRPRASGNGACFVLSLPVHVLSRSGSGIEVSDALDAQVI